MIETVIFDLDGTLMDTSEGLLMSIDDTINYFGLDDLSIEKKRTFIGPPIIKSFKETYNLSDEKATEISNYFRDIYKNIYLYQAKVYDDIYELLDILKESGKKIAVATYKRDDYAKMILEYFNISQYCDFIQGADFENKLSKSDIVRICIDELKSSKISTVLIGDSMNDLIGAKENDIDFIAVTYGFGKFNNKKDIKQINNINELIEYFRKK